MNIKFKTFEPTCTFVGTHNERRSAVVNLNNWLEANPGVDLISWQATPVGQSNDLYIVVQYMEN